MKKLRTWLSSKANLFLVAILIVASFLRLYRISEYMTFLGDEGRDVLIVKGILEGNLTLLGPRASAGDFFTGPIYYYFMAPFLWLFRLDPVGPAIMIALFGVATVYLVYVVGKYFFGVKAGLSAAALYAVAPLVIAYSRSSWNPNPMPFFSLLILFLLYQTVKKISVKKLLLIGVFSGIVMQLHYQTFFLASVMLTFIILGTIFAHKKNRIKNILKHFIWIGAGFIIGIAPFLLFEVRHNFPNTRTIIRFIAFGEGDPGGVAENTSFIQTVGDVWYRIFARLLTRFPPPEQVNPREHLDILIWQIATIIIVIGCLYALLKVKNRLTILFFIIWLAVGIGTFGFYKKPIYDYYFGFLFPLPFLLVGNLISYLSDIKKPKYIGMITAGVLFIGLLGFNLYGAPFRFEPNSQKAQVQGISEFVLSKTNGEPFNFALITPGNSDHGYRYFFELHDQKAVVIENEIIDPERNSVTDQLMIVCEDKACQPLGNSLWEVAGFGRAEIDGEWDLGLVKVFRLVPYEEQ